MHSKKTLELNSTLGFEGKIVISRLLFTSATLLLSIFYSPSVLGKGNESLAPVPPVLVKLTKASNEMLIPSTERQNFLEVVSMFSTLKEKNGKLFPYVKILVKNVSGKNLSEENIYFYSKFHNLTDGKQIVFEFDTKSNLLKDGAKVFKFSPKEGFLKNSVSNLNKGTLRMLIGTIVGRKKKHKSANFSQVLLHGSIRTVEKSNSPVNKRN